MTDMHYALNSMQTVSAQFVLHRTSLLSLSWVYLPNTTRTGCRDRQHSSIDKATRGQVLFAVVLHHKGPACTVVLVAGILQAYMAFRRSGRLLALGRQHAGHTLSNTTLSLHSHASPLRQDVICWTSSQYSWQPACQTLGALRAITTFPSLAASIKVPSMGESIEEGTISAILKQEGESVEMDEAIFQIETDKVTVDVRAPEAGVLSKIMVS